MATYTFYPCQPKGPALCFETLELESDTAALSQASEILSRHETATFVTVWRADRLVCSVPRNAPAAAQADLVTPVPSAPSGAALN